MFRRSTLMCYGMLLLGLTGNASAALVAHWPFNNSPNDQVGTLHWTLNGGATYSTECREGSASLLCDGQNDYAGLPNSGLMIATFTAKTVMLWFKPNTTSGTQIIFDEGGQNQGVGIRINNGLLETSVRASNVASILSTPLASTGWAHVVLSFNGGAVKLYLNGTEVGSATASFVSVPNHSNAAGLGARNGGGVFGNTVTGDYYGGLIDDVRIYDHAVTAAEIQDIGGNKALAGNVSPKDGATDVPRDATLNWAAAETAGAHDVYVGTAFADVNTASRTDAKGVLASRGQTETTYDPPGLFAYGQTYYWRIDEVNKTPDNTIFRGDVWRFTVEPYAYPIQPLTATASSSQPEMGPEKTVDGSGMTGDLHGTAETTMWLSGGTLPNWIQYEFDKVYQLHQLLVWNSNQLLEPFLGFGVKSAKIEYSTDGTAWTALADVPEFARAPGAPGYTANTTVSFGGVGAKDLKLTINTTWGGLPTGGLSEVRFSYVPTQARAPQPANAATGVKIDTTLDWRPGREAASHKVYVGTDQQTVANGTVAAETVTEHGFTPGALDLATTYYWRVDEVNEARTPSVWPGEVWSFTTQDYQVVDDFESYDDAEGKGTRIYEAWLDGYNDPTKNGAVVGLADAVNGTFGETTIVHAGKQSMPLAYDNTKAPLSEATLTFANSQNWALHGSKSLTFYFLGEATNTGRLYVKINNTRVDYPGAVGDIARADWQPCVIDLSKVTSGLQSVTRLTIGVDGAGAKGTLYIDDVRLYPKAAEFITPKDPGGVNLVGHWNFDAGSGTVATDVSGKGRSGTITDGAWEAGKLGSALRFNGTSSYVELPAAAFSTISEQATASVWLYVDSTAAQTPFTFAAFRDPAVGNSRVLSAHVTWNGTVYLDTGGDTAGYDRISKVAAAYEYAGVWTHWAFVKNAQTGEQKIYRNGMLWHSGTGLTRTMTGVTVFTLGVAANKTASFWNGVMDDFRLYDRELSTEEILWLAGKTTSVARPL